MERLREQDLKPNLWSAPKEATKGFKQSHRLNQSPVWSSSKRWGCLTSDVSRTLKIRKSRPERFCRSHFGEDMSCKGILIVLHVCCHRSTASNLWRLCANRPDTACFTGATLAKQTHLRQVPASRRRLLQGNGMTKLMAGCHRKRKRRRKRIELI